MFNDTSSNQGGTINGNATFNTRWYSGTSAPAGGVLTINGSNSWSGNVMGTVYGSDHQAITSYVFNDSAYNNDTINGSVVFNSTADQSGTINAGSGSVSGDFSTAGITFESGTVLSNISGSGGLTKTGTGTAILYGSNTYSGGTTISAGTLQVANASALGTGNVVNNATLDIGTTHLSLGGSYTQNTGSALDLTVNFASSFGKISSAVAASVDGGSTINVTPVGTIVKNTTFTILNTEGAGINFVNGLPIVTSSNPHVSFTDSYSNGNLVLTASSITTGFSALGNNGNSQTVGTVLENIPNPSSSMTTVLNTLGSLSNKQISAALGTMGPIVDRGVLNASTSSLTSSIEASLERAQNVLTLAASRNGQKTGISSGDESLLNGIWAKEYGGYLDQGTREGIPGYSAWNTGTVVGVDHLFSDNLTIGASLGYAYGQVNSADNSGHTYVNSAEGTLYAGYQGETHPFYVDAAASFAWNWYNGQRNISIGSINSIADSSYQGQQSSIYLDGGYKIDVGHNVTITPLASLQWTHLAIGSYTETNAGDLDLVVNRQSYNMLESGLGAGISYKEQYKWGTFTPELHAKWLYDYISDAMVVTSAFTGGGASFTSRGATPAKDGADIGSKLSFDLKNEVSLIAGLDAEVKDNFFGIYGSVSMRYKF